MKQKRIAYVVIMAAAAAVLMGFGLNRVVHVYRNYRSDMLAYESRHLESIVTSGARGLDWLFDGYLAWGEALVQRPEFIRAEAEHMQTEAAWAMRALMDRPDVKRLDMSYSIAVYAPDGAYLAASDADFPRGGDEALGERIALREADGAFWFVFTQTSDAGYIYELAVPVQTVFAEQADAVRVGRGGYFFMLDRDGRFLSWSGQGGSGTESVDTVAQNDGAIDADALRRFAAGSGTPRGGYDVFRYPWPAADGGRGDEQTLVVTARLERNASGLLIGAAMSFQEFDSFLSETLREVSGIIFMEIGGALILFALAAWVLIVNRRSALELRAVRERADLMEEINRQQQSLAHTERLQQLGVMTSGIVHEFNNLLTPIMSQSVLLLEELADRENEPEFEYALDIYEASENARETLKRMSVLGKKDVDMAFRTLELGVLLQKTLNLASMAKAPHIRQELLLPDREIFVSGSEQLLVQTFLNLCINAFQAMEGEGVLTVRLTEELRAGHPYAAVEVADTGPGIPEDALASVFDSYFTTKGEKGTGLGLAICRKIVETHKGTIIAANREIGGAVFTVRIPETASPEDE